MRRMAAVDRLPPRDDDHDRDHDGHDHHDHHDHHDPLDRGPRTSAPRGPKTPMSRSPTRSSSRRTSGDMTFERALDRLSEDLDDGRQRAAPRSTLIAVNVRSGQNSGTERRSTSCCELSAGIGLYDPVHLTIDGTVRHTVTLEPERPDPGRRGRAADRFGHGRMPATNGVTLTLASVPFTYEAHGLFDGPLVAAGRPAHHRDGRPGIHRASSGPMPTTPRPRTGPRPILTGRQPRRPVRDARDVERIHPRLVRGRLHVRGAPRAERERSDIDAAPPET